MKPVSHDLCPRLSARAAVYLMQGTAWAACSRSDRSIGEVTKPHIHLQANLTSPTTSSIALDRDNDHALMASPPALASEKSMMEVSELVEFTKKELAADGEREAQELVAGNGESLSSQTGVTLDISHKSLRTLPVEVIELIRNRVER